MKEYKPRKGSRLNKEQAQKYGQRIAQIIETEGDATAELILEDAKAEDSPLHDFFEWDDTEAARQHRLYQARTIATNIVEVVVVEGVETDQRSFFSVTNEDKKAVYVTVKTAIDNKIYSKQLLDKLINHLQNTTEVMKMFREHA